jgi:hypothetical protein
MKRDLTVSFLEANLIGFLMLIPVGFLGLLYLGLWGWRFGSDPSGFSLDPGATIAYFAAILLGMVLHELIHMATAIYFGRISAGGFRFGIDLKTLSPYFHCKVPLEVTVYRKVTAMPCVLLGLLPSFAGLITGRPWIMLYGLLFTLAAGGDLLILWLLRSLKPGTLVEDHPSRVGCSVIEPEGAS